MKNIDEKFAINDQGQIYKISNGDVIPDDEPLFLVRARDYLAIPLLEHYLAISVEDTCTDYHLDGMLRVIKKFNDFKEAHSEKMKQPGCTRGL